MCTAPYRRWVVCCVVVVVVEFVDDEGVVDVADVDVDVVDIVVVCC